MNEIIIRSKKANVKNMEELERLMIIKRFSPPENLCQAKRGEGYSANDILYKY